MRNRRAARSSEVPQLSWQSIENPYAPIEILSSDQIVSIHETSLRVLEEKGMDFLLPEAREILKSAGAEVVEGRERVRFDRTLVQESIAKAPAGFRLHARNPAHDLKVGGRSINFGAVASPPNVSDLEAGRRPGNYADYCDLVRLAQSLNVVHFFGGYPVEPADLPVPTRHLDALAALVTLSDKVFHAYSLGRQRILDAIEIAKIARGVDNAQLVREPSLFTVVNSNTPLKFDRPMLEGILEMAKAGQPVAVTPFTLSGAMAPATLAGALVLQHAEALAGIALTQIVKPGAPVVYGGFTSNVDMKSGAPAFGTPEYSKAALSGGQLARHLGLPFRTSNANAANCIDAQAAYESEMSLWAAVMAYGNILMHAAGWLEGGLCASFEKMVLDAEMLQMMAEFLKPPAVDEDALAFAAIMEIEPGGHFFGSTHTMERYKKAFYSPLLSDWRNFETWRQAGEETATQRANRLYKKLLANYSEPPLEESRKEALAAFVAKRKEDGGAPDL
jgi:trimethylamine--corrinoid protein Co-methyltransferase